MKSTMGQTNPFIALVGGGVSSLAAGIRLRKLLPSAEIHLYTGVGAEHIGGHLSSWTEDGYEVEHGFHALFGFYEEALALLEDTGVISNFKKSPNHVFMPRNNKLFKMSSMGLSGLSFFDLKERLLLPKFQVALARLALERLRAGKEHLVHYDAYDFREWCLEQGLPKSIAESSFFDQWYAAAFNDPYELSTFVALQSLKGCVSKPWHYYFLKPSRQALIEPLMEYFRHQCKGHIHFNYELKSVKVGVHSKRVEALHFEHDRKRVTINPQATLLALGLEDFKKVDFGKNLTNDIYFKNIEKLKTVSSISLQGWFRQDPVPRRVNAFITGMPKPWVVTCPVSRVRDRKSHSKHPYELISVGAEKEFETAPDGKLIDKFVKDLKNVGFHFSSNWRSEKESHFYVRRNRSSMHRYLLTRPGEWHLRPQPESPVHGLYLSGAWTRGKWGLPCVEGAVNTAHLAASAIARQFEQDGVHKSVPELKQFPIGTWILPPPYRFPKSTGDVFFLKRNLKMPIKLPKGMSVHPTLGRWVMLAAFQHQAVSAETDPSQLRYDYHEVMLAVPVRYQGELGIFPLVLYLNDAAAVSAGREIYGFPKKFAEVCADPSQYLVRREGVDLMKGKWNVTSPALSPQKLTGFLPLPKIAAPFLTSSLPIFNLHEIYDADVPFRLSYQKITRAVLENVKVHSVRAIRDAHFEFNDFSQDLLSHVIDLKEGKTLDISTGVRVEFEFTLGKNNRGEQK